MPTLSKTVYCRADSRVSATFSLTFSESAKDVTNNSSTISWSLSGAQGGITFTGSNRANGATAKVWINGHQVDATALGLCQSPSSFKKSGTYVVVHNSDGNKTINVTLEIDAGSGNYAGDPWTYGSASASEDMKLSTLPRVSDLSCSASSVALGSTVTISLKRHSSSFTDTVGYIINGNKTVIASQSKNTSFSFTPALSLASNFPNATFGTITLFSITYSGDKEIGVVKKDIKITIPASVKPTIKSLSAAIINGSVPKDWNVYVQSKSKVKITVNGAAGVYGSTIKEYTIQGGGFSSDKSTLQTGYLNTPGTITFKATVIDSRGRTSDPKTVSINVVPYDLPKLTSYSVSRSLADGTPSDEGTCALGNMVYSYSDCGGKNAIKAQAYYRLPSASSWTDAKATISSGANFVFGNATLSTASSYEIQYKLTDAFGSASIILNLSTATACLDLKAGGKGAAFGKMAEKDLVLEISKDWTVEAQKMKIQGDVCTAHPCIISTNEAFSAFIKKMYSQASKQSSQPVNFKAQFASFWKPAGSGTLFRGFFFLQNSVSSTAGPSNLALILAMDEGEHFYLGKVTFTDASKWNTTASVAWSAFYPCDLEEKVMAESIHYSKSGNLVSVSIIRMETKGASKAGWVLLGTLPAGYRPAQQRGAAGLNYKLDPDTNGGIVNVKIDSNGEISFWTTASLVNKAITLVASLSYFSA